MYNELGENPAVQDFPQISRGCVTKWRSQNIPDFLVREAQAGGQSAAPPSNLFRTTARLGARGTRSSAGQPRSAWNEELAAVIGEYHANPTTASSSPFGLLYKRGNVR